MTKATGEPCATSAMRDSEKCYWHGRPEAARKASARGGSAGVSKAQVKGLIEYVRSPAFAKAIGLDSTAVRKSSDRLRRKARGF